MIKKVAVPAWKHSPIFGQEASSHTVFSPKSRKISLTLPTRCHWGALTRNQAGLVGGVELGVMVDSVMGWLGC